MKTKNKILMPIMLATFSDNESYIWIPYYLDGTYGMKSVSFYSFDMQHAHTPKFMTKSIDGESCVCIAEPLYIGEYNELELRGWQPYTLISPEQADLVFAWICKLNSESKHG